MAFHKLGKNECNCFVIVVYLLLFYLLSDLLQPWLLLDCLEVILNYFHLSL